MKPFDQWISRSNKLFEHATPFIDGVQHNRCLEAHVNYESFDGQAYGELIVMAEGDDGHVRPVYTCQPRAGEFRCDGVWAKIITGMVEIKLTEAGKALLEKYRSAHAG